MENKIKKSLIDKNTFGFEYNPQIVFNNNFKTIKERLIKNFEEANTIKMAVSYAVWSGVTLILDNLRKFDKNSKILLTTEGLVTDPTSLRALLNLDLEVKVYAPYTNEDKGFHLKSYYFEKTENSTILIGSNNISARAFGLAYEMAVEIDSNDEGMFVEKYNDIFDKLWNDSLSQPLTKDFIDSYEEVYQLKKSQDQITHFLGLDKGDIKPNYMQEKALYELEQARTQYDRGLVIAATGTGKTYLSAFDVKKAKAKKVLFLVHNRLILTSAINSFKHIFKNQKTYLELESTNIDKIAESDMIFTTDKTAHKHLLNKYPANYFDYIIYDEAHRIGDKTLYIDLINYFKPKFNLGITATPERTTDPKFLFQTFEYNVIYEIRLLDALEHELICPFHYYGLNLDEKLLNENEQFNYTELGKFLRKIITEKKHYGPKLKALVFAANIKEAKEVSQALNNEGYNSKVAVSGAANQQEIEDYILSLQSDEPGSTQVICTVNKFNEGVDIPEINTIIMLRNTTSSIIYLQQLGRGLRRTYDPHKYVTVFDIIGNSKNNYTIAEVLTANTTADKRLLYRHAASEFETVSPFINVEIDKKAMENIIRSISNNFTVKTKIRNKLRDELHRYKEIPSLAYMYKSENFKELDLLQLMYKNFYDPFDTYYQEKYNIPLNNIFIRKFFELITQFVFRGYDQDTLRDYISLLNGNPTSNERLRKIFFPISGSGITTAINSDYNKASYALPKAFIKNGLFIELNPKIIEELNKVNALELFQEHIELFEVIANRPTYNMQTFDLVDKGEFLFNVGAKDSYMNVVGERIDHEKKVVYCTIKITEKESHYDNYIVDDGHDNKVVYYTQSSATKQQAENKIEKFINEKYKFYVCAQFPHLGYANTSYFNLGDVEAVHYSEALRTEKGKFNHEITFKLSKPLPKELVMYRDDKFKSRIN